MIRFCIEKRTCCWSTKEPHSLGCWMIEHCGLFAARWKVWSWILVSSSIRTAYICVRRTTNPCPLSFQTDFNNRKSGLFRTSTQQKKFALFIKSKQAEDTKLSLQISKVTMLPCDNPTNNTKKNITKILCTLNCGKRAMFGLFINYKKLCSKTQQAEWSVIKKDIPVYHAGESWTP